MLDAYDAYLAIHKILKIFYAEEKLRKFYTSGIPCCLIDVVVIKTQKIFF